MDQSSTARQPAAVIRAAHAEQRVGVACGLSAHLLWGIFPIYIKLVSNAPALQILAHRIAWSVLVVAIVFVVIFAIGRVLRRLRAPGGGNVTGLLAT